MAPRFDADMAYEETLFLIDWDDTILPSSWIQRHSLSLDFGCIPDHQQQGALAEVAASARELLILAKRRGTVVVVTNAEVGWIELSCQKFLPTLLPFVESLRTVSARTCYETQCCASPVEWKSQAFAQEIDRAFGEAVADPARRKNILSLGDSTYEREALIRATASMPNCRSKSLKFVERPDMGQLLRQHALVSNCLEQIVQLDDNLDLGINCP